MSDTAESLIKSWIEVDDHIKVEAKRFQEYQKPFMEQRQDLANKLLALLNERKEESVRTDSGTAYKSTSTTPKVVDREAYVDYCMENWDKDGNALLQIGAPQVTAFKAHMEDHEGRLPPGTDVQSFTHVNVRRS